MNVYITAGTYPFLKSIQNKYPGEGLVMMTNVNGALLLHETDGKSVFKEPRKYEVLYSAGKVGEEGFVVMDNLPVTDEGRPLFEHQFKDGVGSVEKVPGFVAMRVLRPQVSNTYVIMTVWETQADYLSWNGSNSFFETKAKAEKGIDNLAIFSSAAYVSTYVISSEK